jgi:hypothetical protein
LCSCCFNCFSWDILVQLLLQLFFLGHSCAAASSRFNTMWSQSEEILLKFFISKYCTCRKQQKKLWRLIAVFLTKQLWRWCQVTFSMKKKRGKTWHDDLQVRSTLGRIWQSCLESETEIIW